MIRNDRRGFTLVELMMVVAIVGTMAAMGAYTLRFTGATSIAIQRADLADALQQARGTAQLRSECVRVSIVDNVYRATSFPADSGRRCEGPFNTPQLELPEIDFGARGATVTPFSNGQTSIVFNTLGGVVGDDVLTFEISSKGEVARFRIYPAIGQIRLL